MKTALGELEYAKETVREFKDIIKETTISLGYVLNKATTLEDAQHASKVCLEKINYMLDLFLERHNQ